MPALNIPEQYRPGLTALRDLSEPEVGTLVETFKGLPPTTWLKKDLISAVSAALPGVPTQKIDSLILTLQSLYQVRAATEAALKEFVIDVLDAMVATGRPELEVPTSRRDHFVARLETVLGVDSLNFLAKAAALQRDHEHIFHDAKILTDLRPVFHAPDEPPREVILEYTLKIVFHDGNRHREIYMALDTDDMSRLRKVVERAEEKAASLHSLLKSKGITHLRLP
jgi:hypothetical protein